VTPFCILLISSPPIYKWGGCPHSITGATRSPITRCLPSEHASGCAPSFVSTMSTLMRRALWSGNVSAVHCDTCRTKSNDAQRVIVCIFKFIWNQRNKSECVLFRICLERLGRTARLRTPPMLLMLTAIRRSLESLVHTSTESVPCVAVIEQISRQQFLAYPNMECSHAQRIFPSHSSDITKDLESL